jgi:hypothetical protein
MSINRQYYSQYSRKYREMDNLTQDGFRKKASFKLLDKY